MKTGKNVERLMAERGLTARDVQRRLGFAEYRPVHFWISGKNLSSIDSLFTLADMMHVSMDDILIAKEEYANRHHDDPHGA